MEPGPNDGTVKPAKKSCTECRQQKSRCDSHLHPGEPCSRCKRWSLDCVISTSFKREHKRSRLSELEQEAETLRKKLRTSEPRESRSGSENSLPLPKATTVQLPPLNRGHAESTAVSSLTHRPTPPHSTLYALRSSLGHNQHEFLRDEHHTMPRVLNGVLVTASEVDDIFQIFFERYSRYLPILDQHISPNIYYTRSEFLFWSIIGVACRTYSSNPSLLISLSPAIMDLALLSTNSSSKPIYSIQGLLLLVNWPLVKDPTKLDISYALAGITIHRAKQNGFHNPRSSSEFGFGKDRKILLSEDEIKSRYDLWVRSYLTYQCSCLSKGFLPHNLNDVTVRPEIDTVDPHLKLRLRCLGTLARCCAAVVESGTVWTTAEQKRTLGLILQAYEHQLKDIEVDAGFGSQPSDTFSATLDNLYICTSQLTIQAFHINRESTVTFDGSLATLLATACKTIDTIELLTQDPAFPPSPPQFIIWALMQASFILLRLLKTPMCPGVDSSTAIRHISHALVLAKRLTTHSNDVLAKTHRILTQLWDDPNAFKKHDGSPDLEVRCHNRLTLNIIMDALWRWHDLFEQQIKPPSWLSNGNTTSANTTATASTEADHLDIPPATTPANSLSAPPPPPADVFPPQTTHFEDPTFTDFYWALGDDFFSL